MHFMRFSVGVQVFSFALNKYLVCVGTRTKSYNVEGGGHSISWDRRVRRTLMIPHRLPQLDLRERESRISAHVFIVSN